MVGLALRGNAVHCPCCGRSYRRFVDYPSAYCPGCGAYERQRLLCLYLDRNRELVTGDVLHIAPEQPIIDRYRSSARSWLAVDIDPDHPLIDRTMDVMRLELPDAAFDLVLCAHVLDVVPDLESAVRELYRVTRPGGTAIVQLDKSSLKGRAEHASTSRDSTSTWWSLPEQADDGMRRRLGLDSDAPLFVCRR